MLPRSLSAACQSFCSNPRFAPFPLLPFSDFFLRAIFSFRFRSWIQYLTGLEAGRRRGLYAISACNSRSQKTSDFIFFLEWRKCLEYSHSKLIHVLWEMGLIAWTEGVEAIREFTGG